MSGKWIVSLALVACVAGTGCAAMSSGKAKDAGVKYVFGDLQGTLDADVARIYDVSMSVVESMGLRLEKAAVTEIDAEIVAYTARDRKVSLRVDSLGGGQTQLSIRIDQFGDEDLSLRIYKRIEEDI